MLIVLVSDFMVMVRVRLGFLGSASQRCDDQPLMLTEGWTALGVGAST